jgi:hypothetical protein
MLWMLRTSQAEAFGHDVDDIDEPIRMVPCRS